MVTDFRKFFRDRFADRCPIPGSSRPIPASRSQVAVAVVARCVLRAGVVREAKRITQTLNGWQLRSRKARPRCGRDGVRSRRRAPVRPLPAEAPSLFRGGPAAARSGGSLALSAFAAQLRRHRDPERPHDLGTVPRRPPWPHRGSSGLHVPLRPPPRPLSGTSPSLTPRPANLFRRGREAGRCEGASAAGGARLRCWPPRRGRALRRSAGEGSALERRECPGRDSNPHARKDNGF